MKRIFLVMTCLIATADLGLSAALACTGITLKPADGSVISARTLEFAADLQSNVIVVPRGQDFVGTAPGGKPGIRAKTRYAVLGANAFDLPLTVDGLNEKGLYVGLFYFPGYAKYQAVKPDELDKALAPWELGYYLLTTCSDVKQVSAAVKNVRVGEVVQKDMGFVPPVHYVVTDATGRSVVIEPLAGELVVFDNPLGVITNSPSFDWHMTNLSNYVNMSVTNVPLIEVGGEKLKAFGQGTGMLGLPGDFTPPSRFVRAVAFSKSALPVETAAQGVEQAFHILNQFDIPKGAARGKEHGKEVADYTLWTAASDLKNLRYYFRTFENSRIRMVDLKSFELEGGKVKTISMAGGEKIENLSGSAH